jgi:hypothetical protein
VSVINQPQIKEKVISCKVMVIESLGQDKKLQGKAQVYFRKFYNNQNIYHQGFFNHSQWVHLNQNTSNVLLSMGYSWQLELKKLFNKYFEDDAVRGVSEAVIFFLGRPRRGLVKGIFKNRNYPRSCCLWSACWDNLFVDEFFIRYFKK